MTKEMKLMVSDNLEVVVISHEEHEFLMDTNGVATGYGIKPESVRSLKREKASELKEGIHYQKGGVTFGNDPLKSNNYNDSQKIWWTKRGVVRLGFSIQSDRAKMFRDWAEDLVISVEQHVTKSKSIGILPEAPKRNHNRLSRDRLVDILADVAKIEDKKLRLRLVEKLMAH